MTAPLPIRVVDVYPYRRVDARVEWLVLRRTADRPYGGAWRMVGGKVEPGESAHAAARRELREETGADASLLWTIPSVNAFYEWGPDRLTFAPAFAAELPPDAPVALDAEHDAHAWLPADDAAARLVWPEQARLLRLADICLARGLDPAWIVDAPHGGGAAQDRPL